MLPFDVNRCALILIDLQNDFCHPKGTASLRGKNVESLFPALKKMSHLLDVARHVSMPIIHVISEHSRWTSSPSQRERFGRTKPKKALQYCQPNSWGAEIYHLFRPLRDEKVIVKHRYSAFYETNLALILRAKNIKQIILIGLYTDVCVDTTARDAYMRDFSVWIPRDAVASDDTKKHSYALYLLDGTFAQINSAEEIIQKLKRKISNK